MTNVSLVEELEKIGERRFIAFIRSIRNQRGCPSSVKIINRRLDNGCELKAIFKNSIGGLECIKELGLTPGPGFTLEVEEQTPQQFGIRFGCQMGPTEGDGGEWLVLFDSDDNVVVANGGQTWIS